MKSNINFKVDMDTTKFNTKSKEVVKNTTKVGRENTKMGNSFAASSKKIKEQGNRFANIAKDANRTANAFSKLKGSLGFLTGFAGFSILAKGIESTINASMDAIETQNLFAVALGSNDKAAQGVVDSLHELYGLDPTNLQSSMGTYALLAKSMGMTGDQAETLSTQLTQAAIDYSSLTNVPINQVLSDLKSGLVGQSETVYKYGMDVTEAGIKSEALAEGITKSVRNMTQGEKMVLRYNVVMKNLTKDLGGGTTVMGDFARTINTPANQVKILTDRVVTLTRAIGDIFMPIVAQALPMLNALALVATRAANAIAEAMAKLFGYKKPETVSIGDSLSGVSDDAEDMSGSIDDANDSAKKLKKTLLGIDEINLMAKPETTSSSGGSGVTGASAVTDMTLLSPYKLLESMPSKADEVAKIIEEKLKPAFEDLGKSFSNVIEFGRSFYYYVLKPIGKWTIGTGIPALFGAVASFNREVVPKLKEDLLPVVGKLWSDFLEPILTFTVNEAVPAFFDLLGDFVEGVSPIIDAVVSALIEIWNNFLKPLAGWVIGTGFDILGDWFVSVGTFLKENPMAMDFLTELVKQLIILSAIKFTADKLSPLITLLKSIPAEGSSFIKLLNSNVAGTSTVGAAGPLPANATTGQTAIAGLAGVSIGTVIGNWLTGSDLGANVSSVFNDIFSGAAEAAGASVAGYFEYVFSGGFIESVADTSTPLGYLAKLETLVIESLKGMFGTIGTNISDAWNGYWEIISSNFNGVIGYFASLPAWFSEQFGKIGKGASNVCDSIGKFFSDSYRNITGYFAYLPSWFSSIFSSAWEGIKRAFSSVGSFFGGIWSTITRTFTDIGNTMGSAIGNTFKQVVNGVLGTAESIVNKVIGAINTAIDAYNNIMPGTNLDMKKLGTVSFPRLAKGGIVTSSTFAEIGEAGDEAVMPLNPNALSKYLKPVLGNNNNEMNYETMVAAFDEALSRHDKEQNDVINMYFDGVYSGTVENARRRNSRAGKVVIPIGV